MAADKSKPRLKAGASSGKADTTARPKPAHAKRIKSATRNKGPDASTSNARSTKAARYSSVSRAAKVDVESDESDWAAEEMERGAHKTQRRRLGGRDKRDGAEKKDGGRSSSLEQLASAAVGLAWPVAASFLAFFSQPCRARTGPPRGLTPTRRCSPVPQATRTS